MLPERLTEDWKGRFRLIHGYLNYHHFCNLGDVGGRPEIARMLKSGFGLRVRGALRQFCVLTFGLSSLEYQAVFRDNVCLGKEPAEGFCSIMESAEEDFLWTFAKKDLQFDDPPVYELQHDFSGAGKGWIEGRKWDRLTTWLMDYIITNNLGRPEQPKLGRKLLRFFNRKA